MIDIMKQGLGLRTPQQERFGNSQELKSFGGRYRTRTARPRRRRGNQSPSGALISARFPTARNVYRDDYRFVVGGTGLEQQQRPQRNRKFHSAGGYSFIGEYGILGLVQQIRIYIKENIDATVFMFALFKCRKSDKGRN